MNHIFLSYSRKNKDLMLQVKDTLLGAGIDVWTDENLSHGTAEWEGAIADAIENAAGMVVLLSPDAKKSKWIGREIAFAETHQIDIFPFLIKGDEKDSVPFRLVSYQRIDAQDSLAYGVGRLVNTLVAFLGIQTGEAQTQTKKLSSNELLLIFWKNLQSLSAGRFEDFSHLTPGERYYLSKSGGRAGFYLSYNIMREGYGMQLYIDTGKQDKNEAYFDVLYAEKDVIENELQRELDWRRLEDKRACRITLYVPQPQDFEYRKPETWNELQLNMINAMKEFSEVFLPRVRKIKI